MNKIEEVEVELLTFPKTAHPAARGETISES